MFRIGTRVRMPSGETGVVITVVRGRGGAVWEYDIRCDTDHRVVACQPQYVERAESGEVDW
jgi:hypothetical protein